MTRVRKATLIAATTLAATFFMTAPAGHSGQARHVFDPQSTPTPHAAPVAWLGGHFGHLL